MAVTSALTGPETIEQIAFIVLAISSPFFAIKEGLVVTPSTKPVGKRLASIDVENTEENRKAYRGRLFTTKGLGEFISGAILFEETLVQNHQDGQSMVKKLEGLGIIPGIKVDKGAI